MLSCDKVVFVQMFMEKNKFTCTFFFWKNFTAKSLKEQIGFSEYIRLVSFDDMELSPYTKLWKF